MEQRDYIEREIEKIGVMLSAILQKIMGKGAIETPLTIAEIKNKLQAETGFDLDKYLSLTAQESDGYIDDFRGFNLENSELLAEILAQTGYNEKSDKAKIYLEKALHLYELCDLMSGTYSFARAQQVTLIRSCVESLSGDA